MKVLKVMLATERGIEEYDAIEHQEKLWLVPEWLDWPEQGISKPARIIRFDLLPHQESSLPDSDYILNWQLPKGVLDGHLTFAEGIQYEVVETPDIRVRIPPSALD